MKTAIKNKSESVRIMIMAGGTGGHVMPALAVARYLQENPEISAQVHWLGTRNGIESRIVPQAGIPIHYIDIQGIRRVKWSWLFAPFKIAKAFLQSCRVILKERPHVVLSMGGYVSGPGALAAWFLRRPLVLHEQNAIPGWTNKILAKLASSIMVAFPNVFNAYQAQQTGNPVRQDILNVSPKVQRDRKAKLLILGGSQGANIFNEMLPRAIALLPPEIRPEICHQTGKAHLEKTIQNYQAQGLDAKITDFIDDMAQAYAQADIVIARSGALTIAELSAVGVASILIPFPYAVDNHQMHNAKYLSDQNAAILLPQTELTEQKIAELLSDFIAHPEKQFAMAQACRALGKPLATQKVAQCCLESI